MDNSFDYEEEGRSNISRAQSYKRINVVINKNKKMGSVRQEKATRVNLIDNILLPPNNFKVVVEVGIVFFFASFILDFIFIGQ